MRVVVDPYQIKELVKKHLINNYDMDGELARYISDDIEKIIEENEDD